jgi:hypothetical protein
MSGQATIFDRAEGKKIGEYQLLIPSGLSASRYISGKAALNLPAPEGTSGDWHFFGYFYSSNPGLEVYIAGEGESVNTNHIYRDYGVYNCSDGLKKLGLNYEGKVPYAANHFRAILDLLYDFLLCDMYPRQVQFASEEFLDTAGEKALLLAKAAAMSHFLAPHRQALLRQWLEKESLPGYRE